MLAFRVALRYLFSRKSHGAVNVISAISVVGVAVATAAMIIVLSVFNGFSELSVSKLSKFDPPVLVVPTQGKVFAGADSIAATLEALPEVGAARAELTEQAFAVAQGSQMAVTLKGVDSLFVERMELRRITIDGTPLVGHLTEGLCAGMLSTGAAMGLQTTPKSPWTVKLYEPRRSGRYNPANPTRAFRTDSIAAMGVLRVEQEEYDRDMVLVPLDMARKLLEYNAGEASGIAVWPAQGVTGDEVYDAVAEALRGHTGLKVLDRMGQQPDIFRMISVEKWITFVMLAFILIIASFNIVSTLSMMVLEKRPNMGVLRAMGGTQGFVSRIFANQGWLVTLAGGAVGLLLGALLVAGQARYGWLKLQGDPSLLSVQVYPVALEWGDVVTVGGLLLGAAAVMAAVGGALAGGKRVNQN